MNAENTQTPNETNRRRSYLVNPAFQWKYAVMLGLGVFIATSMLSCVLYGTLFEAARQRFVNPVAASFDAGLVILLCAFGFSLLTAGTVITLSVITSHRICGPLLVLQGYFNQIVAGRIPTPRPLRKKDEFKDIFESFVQATETLRANERAQFDTCEQLLALTHDISSNDKQASNNAIHALTNELTKLHSNLAQALDIEQIPTPADAESNPALNETREPVHANA